jgi:hypothetical protein
MGASAMERTGLDGHQTMALRRVHGVGTDRQPEPAETPKSRAELLAALGVWSRSHWRGQYAL